MLINFCTLLLTSPCVIFIKDEDFQDKITKKEKQIKVMEARVTLNLRNTILTLSDQSYSLSHSSIFCFLAVQSQDKI